MAKQDGMDRPLNQDKALYVCMYAPEFPAQSLLRFRGELRDKACVVMDGEPPKRYVCSLNSRARKLGIVPGMTQIEIDTFPSVTALPRVKAQEATAKAALLQCAGAFSPRVEDQSNDTYFLCVMDIAGTEKLFGVARTLAENLLERVRALAIVVRITVSRNFHAAVCLARRTSAGNPVALIPAGKEAAVLAMLPLSVLDLSTELAETFSTWGIRTLGMLAALPERSLIARIGQDGKRLSQMARGNWPHLFLPIEPAFKLEEHVALDSPVELLSSLLFILSTMLEQLALRVSARAQALASVTITLFLEGNSQHLRTVRPALPSNDRQLWIKLIHLDFEAHPPQSAILALTVSAEAGIVRKTQLGLFTPPLPEPDRFDITRARIQAIVGKNNAGSATLNDSHHPDTFHLDSFSVPSDVANRAIVSLSRVPMRVLRPPEPVIITLSGNRPLKFSFRGVTYTVVRAYGPWLANSDWWSSTLWGYEQWDLIARTHNGSLIYCCLVHDLIKKCWQMTGLYD
jgi:protein ImuB